MRCLKLFMICFGFCFLCACNRESEPVHIPTSTTIPTKQPENMSPTAAPTPTVVPTPTDTPKAVMIPIDEIHFGSALFCEFIAKEYDSDSDGYLSEAERYEVTEIIIPGWYDADYSEACLDGFEYFPNLEGLGIDRNAVNKVIIRNHPTLKNFGGTEGGIQELEVIGCKELEIIGFYTYNLGSVLIADVSPKTEFCLGDNVPIKEMALDENLQIHKTDARDGGQVLFRTLDDGTFVYEYWKGGAREEYELIQIPVTILKDETGDI
ncbi:MAG: hypothetical protein IKB07_03805 [Lachnospiraceae bacterium]|nr:hypothetical protein [Lachnospiraceae bacterium]